MSSYDRDGDKRDSQSYAAERATRAGYRPGWLWIAVAATLLLITLVVATGFIFGDYSGATRAHDDGSLIEQSSGDTSMPGLPTPAAEPGSPDTGAVGRPERPLVRPEEAPPLANDGQ